jgi:hypothetical protein
MICSTCLRQWSLALALGVVACNNTDESELSYHPPPELDAKLCDVPLPPEFAGTGSQVIGDGSAASCTIEALRVALESGGRVTFNCGSAPVTLAVDETLLVTDGTSIDGDGKVILDGEDRVRILRTDNHSTVLLQGLTFQNGHSRSDSGVDGADGSGGAIQRGWQSTLYVKDCNFNDNVAEGAEGFGGGAIATASSGYMTLVGCTFSANRSPLGGAIHSLLSDLFVVDSHFEDNEATAGDGGAIFTDGAFVPSKSEPGVFGGTISLCGTRFLNNTATASAGAGFLYAYGIDQLAINRCEFRGNRVSTAEPGLGGALRIDAEAFVNNSLFVDNATAGQGGALWMGRGPAVFENVTFYGNHATLWGGAISYGDQSITLDNCTVARNIAGEGSDGLFGNDDVLLAHNTLLAENGVNPSPTRHCRVALQGDHNLAFPADENDACGAGLLHGDPLIASALADNGGSTETLLLGVGSAALEAGVDCPASDQRGESRKSASCDLGAVEQ